MIPVARIDCASSSSLASSKVLRGCCSPGRIKSISISRSSSLSCGDGAVDISALSPLPNGFLFMGQHLLCELEIAFGAARPRVVMNHGFAMTWRFGQADIPRNECFQDETPVEFS